MAGQKSSCGVQGRYVFSSWLHSTVTRGWTMQSCTATSRGWHAAVPKVCTSYRLSWAFQPVLWWWLAVHACTHEPIHLHLHAASRERQPLGAACCQRGRQDCRRGDSLPSPASAQFMGDFKHYLARRADVTQKLEYWTDAAYDMPLQTDSSSCGVLMLMAAEAVIHSIPLSVVNQSAVSSCRMYLKTRLLLNSRPYDVDADAVCDMPLCVQPTGARNVWTQRNHWLHNKCSDRLMMAARSKKWFVCELCLL